MFQKASKNQEAKELFPVVEGNLSDYGFQGQKAQEEILLHLQQHPMTMYKLGLALVGAALIVVATFALAGASVYSSIPLGIYVVIGGYYAFRAWYLWHGSHYILTTERVISVDQKGFFHRAVSEAPLDKIQNVSYEIEGPYQTFLDYGMVRILTAGQKDADVEFRFVHHPYDVQQEITDAAHTYGNVVVEAQELETKKNYVS